MLNCRNGETWRCSCLCNLEETKLRVQCATRQEESYMHHACRRVHSRLGWFASCHHCRSVVIVRGQKADPFEFIYAATHTVYALFSQWSQVSRVLSPFKTTKSTCSYKLPKFLSRLQRFRKFRVQFEGSLETNLDLYAAKRIWSNPPSRKTSHWLANLQNICISSYLRRRDGGPDAVWTCIRVPLVAARVSACQRDYWLTPWWKNRPSSTTW